MSIPPAATIGTPLEDVDTPALLIDLDAFERNLQRMAAAAAQTGVAVRAHAKTHKCAVIAQQQIAHGAVGVCCQKVGEAEAMVDGGVGDVFISNEIVARPKIERLAALGRRARVSVAVDDASVVPMLGDVARGYGVTLNVLVEVKVMPTRCGVPPGEAVVALARQVADTPGLHFAGMHAYQGLAQHLPSAEERRQAIAVASGSLRMTRELLSLAELPCQTVTGGGTGTYRYEAGSGVYNEIQPGSYIFMDIDYARIGGEGGGTFTEFEHSLFVYTQVISASEGAAVVDAGIKAFTTEKGMPGVHGRGDVAVTRASDEHGQLELSGGATLRVGEKLLLIPPHCDPTVNLHDWYLGIRNGRVEALWPITARGAMR